MWLRKSLSNQFGGARLSEKIEDLAQARIGFMHQILITNGAAPGWVRSFKNQNMPVYIIPVSDPRQSPFTMLLYDARQIGVGMVRSNIPSRIDGGGAIQRVPHDKQEQDPPLEQFVDKRKQAVVVRCLI